MRFEIKKCISARAQDDSFDLLDHETGNGYSFQRKWQAKRARAILDGTDTKYSTINQWIQDLRHDGYRAAQFRSGNKPA